MDLEKNSRNDRKGVKTVDSKDFIDIWAVVHKDWLKVVGNINIKNMIDLI
jgi:hypothetical protein